MLLVSTRYQSFTDKTFFLIALLYIKILAEIRYLEKFNITLGLVLGNMTGT